MTAITDMSNADFREHIARICGQTQEITGAPHADPCCVRTPEDKGYVRCPDHKNGGATSCPRGGAALQIWQRKQWGD